MATAKVSAPENQRREKKGYDKVGQEVKRLWGNVPVFDAVKELRVFVAPCDLEGATPGDPQACVFARALQRACGSKQVLIYRTVAYADLPNETGERRVERFKLGPGMRAVIENFDLHKPVLPSAGFCLAPPSPYMRFENRARQSAKDRESRKRRMLLGERIGGEEEKRDKKRETKTIIYGLAVRSGSGLVHFTRSTETED